MRASKTHLHVENTTRLDRVFDADGQRVRDLVFENSERFVAGKLRKNRVRADLQYRAARGVVVVLASVQPAQALGAENLRFSAPC